LEGAVDLRQLELFVAVAEEEHVTNGARRAHVTQSTASATVRRLEQELGVELFHRVGRRVALTYAGNLLLERARVMLGEARRTREQFALLKGPLRGHVRLAVPVSCGGFDLPGALAAFRSTFPRVTIGITQAMGPVDGRTDVLLHEEADLAVLPVSGREPPQIRLDHLSRMQAALVCRDDDELARRTAVRLADVADRPFIDFPPAWGNRRTMDRLFAKARVRREVAIEVADIRTAQSLIAAGVGIGFLPAECVSERPRLARVDLVEAPPHFEVGLASRSDRPLSQTAAALREVLCARADVPVNRDH
jgi:DNA-binding transcriptional LysR family regulator